jgi:hypothetical protein
MSKVPSLSRRAKAGSSLSRFNDLMHQALLSLVLSHCLFRQQEIRSY